MQEEYREYINEQLIKQREMQFDKSRPMNELDLLYQIPTECPFRRDDTISDSVSDILQPSPDPLKYSIFLDLWKRKYFITNGNSFGGDFLIYPQDPIICHASHVVHVLNTGRVSIKDFVTANRLCVGAKKECLFAHVDRTDQKIKYQSSVWDSSWDWWMEGWTGSVKEGDLIESTIYFVILIKEKTKIYISSLIVTDKDSSPLEYN